MKKFEGMIPPTSVFADEGKNGDSGPPPSSFIDIGAVAGLAIRDHRAGYAWAYSFAVTGRTTASVAAATPANAHDRDEPPAKNARHANGASAATARAPAITCSRSTERSSARFPWTVRYKPTTSASANRMAAAPSGDRSSR